MSPSTGPLAHHLPWYFGVALAVVWAVVVVAAGLLAYRRWHGRAGRRAQSPSAPVRDDRSLGPGDDLEVW